MRQHTARVDPLDRKIMDALAKDGRVPFTELARRFDAAEEVGARRRLRGARARRWRRSRAFGRQSVDAHVLSEALDALAAAFEIPPALMCWTVSQQDCSYDDVIHGTPPRRQARAAGDDQRGVASLRCGYS